MMRMRLKRDIRRSAFSTKPGLFESYRFGVDDIVVDISSLSDGRAVSRYYNATDERIR